MVQLALACGAVAIASTGSASARLISTVPEWGVTTSFHNVGTDPAIDYDQVLSDQPIDLDGISFFAIAESEDLCRGPAKLQDGLSYTLVATTGGLSGTMTYGGTPLGEGAIAGILPIGRSCMNHVGQLEFHYHESGPVQTVTATVVDGSSIAVTTTRLAVPRGPVETNQPVTLTATVRPSSGAVAGTVSFFDKAAWSEAPMCSDVPVELVDGSWTATCEARLRAPHEFDDFMWSGNLRAMFTPVDAAALVGSATTNWLTVRPGRTATQLEIAPTATGQMLATATVAPAYTGPFSPTGAVGFYDNGLPVAGCASRPLPSSGALEVTCNLGVLSPGQHLLLATYLGDDRFTASGSGLRKITIPPAIQPPTAAPPQPVGTAAGTETPTAPPHHRRAPGRRAARCRRPTHRAHGRAHMARKRRCTTIRARKHTRGAGGLSRLR